MKLKELIISMLICQFAGLIGSVFTFQAIPTWYVKLVKPAFTPPSWVFGPVWVLLYTLMGIGVYWVYNSKNKAKGIALALFGAQLVLNSLWSIVFFGLHSPLFGLAVIVLLWLVILATAIKFYEVDPKAGLILVPYLLWVSLASVLNYYILILN